MSSGAKKELLDAGIQSHEEQVSALLTENGRLALSLNGMTRSRDAWRHAYEKEQGLWGTCGVHTHDCASIDGKVCDCPAIISVENPEPNPEMLEALARRELGDEARVIVLPLSSLPAWTDIEGVEHPPMSVVRVEIRIDGKSFGMEGPEIAAPGFVAYMATQLKTAREASPIIEPPPGFRP